MDMEKAMTNFEMFLEILRVVVWPLTLLIALILFRHEVRSILVRLRRGKIMGQELELSEEAQKIEKQVEAAQKTESSSPLAIPAQDKAIELSELESSRDEVRRFLAEATQDKHLALIKIWADIEYELRAHAAARGMHKGFFGHEVTQYVTELTNRGIISKETAESIKTFRTLKNQMIHGRPRKSVGERELVAVLDSGLRLLQLLRLMPRAAYIVEAVVPFYSDPAATVPVEGAHAVVFRRTTADGRNTYVAVPTTKKYERGQFLSSEWNPGRSWGPAWYRNIETQEIEKAWEGNFTEFIGKPLEEIG